MSRRKNPQRRPAIPRRTRALLGLLALPTVLALGGALGLARWRRPTPVEFTATVSRLSFAVAGAQPAPLVGRGAQLTEVTAHRFADLRLAANLLTVLYPPAGEPLPGGPIVGAREVRLKGLPGLARPRAVVTGGAAGAAVALDRIWVEPGTQVTLERRAAGPLILRTDGGDARTVLVARGLLEIAAEHCRLEAPPSPAVESDLLIFRVTLDRVRTGVNVSSLDRRLGLALAGLPAGTELAAGLPVRALTLNRSGLLGDLESAVVGGVLAFPGLDRPEVAIAERGWVALEPVDSFQLDSLSIAEPGGLRLRVSGAASRVATRRGGRVESHQLSALDDLIRHRLLGILAAITVWVFPTTVAAHKLVGELRRHR